MPIFAKETEILMDEETDGKNMYGDNYPMVHKK